MRILLTITIALTFFAMPVLAETINVRAGDHGSFSRVVFDWPYRVGYRLERQSGDVIVVFDRGAAVNFAPYRRIDPIHAGPIEALDLDPLIVRIAADPMAEIENFRMNTKIVIDIRAVTMDMPKAVVDPEDVLPITEALERAGIEIEPLPPELAIIEEEPVTEAEAEAEPEPEIVLELEPVPDPTEIFNDFIDPLAAFEQQEAEAEATTAQLLVPEAEIEAIAAGRTKEPTLTGYNPGGSDPGEILAVLRIAPLIPVKAAVFERGGYLWAVFDEPLERVPPERLGPQGNRIERPERFLIEGGTAFRFSVPFAHAIDTFHDGLVWDIVILDKPRAKPSVFARVRESDDHTENLLHIDTGPAVPALEVTDPDVGDRLLVVPFDDPGTVFSENRRYPELELLPAVQGVVIRPIRDDLIVECGDDGIVIRAPAGLKLSYSTEDLEGMGRDLGRGSVTRAFDFDSWRRGPRSEWHNQRRLLETVLIKTDEADRVTAMLDLARFHFAHGMAQEALGILDLALENKPEIEKSPQFRALRGGALAYAHRHNETVRDLSRDLWGDHPEIALWRGYAQAENGDWRSAADSFAMAGDLIKFYPDPFRAKLGLVAAEAALIAGDTKSAKRIANQIREPGIPDDEAARAGLDWIEGGIQARKGDIDKAREAWERIAQSGDRFYRAKARLSLIDLLSDRGEINSDEAIEQLESMRFAWRNSELEFDVLNRLGTLHLAAGHARSGMTLLRQAAALIPNSPEAERIARTLTETYRKLFVEGGADELEAVEAFALYQDFCELTPSGEEGDAAIRRLAGRLVELDLLEMAGDLLHHQVRYRLKGEEKADVGARLAAIRLLHGDPGKALIVLDLSEVEEEIPDEIVRNRTLLHARALAGIADRTDTSGLDKQICFDKALALIEEMTGPEIDDLRLDINWRAGNWAEAANGLEAMIGPKPAENVLDAKTATMVLNRAIALTLIEDRAELDALRTDFCEAMKSSADADAFAILTRPETETGEIPMMSVDEQMRETDLFRTFLERTITPEKTTDEQEG